jgi:hypothetical protein
MQTNSGQSILDKVHSRSSLKDQGHSEHMRLLHGKRGISKIFQKLLILMAKILQNHLKRL